MGDISDLADVARHVRIGWEYVDREHGWGVRIDELKTLTVVRMTRAKQLTFD